jgi:arylsulfatase A-like enzyme
LTFGWSLGAEGIGASVALAAVETGLNVAVGLVLGAVTAGLRRRHAPFAAGLVALGLSLWLTVRCASYAARLLTGAYLSRGSIQFAVNGWEHLGAASAALYGRELATIAGMGLGHALAAWWLLRRGRAPRALGRARGVVLASLVMGGVGLTWLHSRGAQAATLRVHYAKVSSLALVSSYVQNAPTTTSGEDSDRRGPPLSVGQQWHRQLQRDPHAPANVLLITLESIAERLVTGDSLPGRRPLLPRLNALMRRSLRFSRTWSTASHSNYAQMSILSSLFPRRGAGLDMYQRLDYPRLLFHDVLNELGYATATISSQDENWQGMSRFEDTGTPTYFFHSPDYAGDKLSIGSEDIVPDHVTVEHALRWLSRRKTSSWGLYLNLQSTHFPYPLPAGQPEPFQPVTPTPGQFGYFDYPLAARAIALNRYRNALQYVDRQLGRIEDYLRDTGQLEDTLWVITADHGESFHEHGTVTHGRTLYESETRVPLLFHWPAGLAAAVDDRPTSQLDILPTVLALLGTAQHPSFQGINLRAQRSDGHAVFMNLQGVKTVEGIVCFPWKLTFDRLTGVVELYHLGRDPQELNTLTRQRPRVAEALATRLQEMIAAQVAYHQGAQTRRDSEYAPRLPGCPADLPALP